MIEIFISRPERWTLPSKEPHCLCYLNSTLVSITARQIKYFCGFLPFVIHNETYLGSSSLHSVPLSYFKKSEAVVTAEIGYFGGSARGKRDLWDFHLPFFDQASRQVFFSLFQWL